MRVMARPYAILFAISLVVALLARIGLGIMDAAGWLAYDYISASNVPMIDVICSILTGSAFAGQVKPLGNTEAPSRNGHFFIAVDVAAFYSEAEYQERYNELVGALKASGEAVRLPGERLLGAAAGAQASCDTSENVTENAEQEIVLSDAQYAELMALKDELEGAPEGALGGGQRGASENVSHGSAEGSSEDDFETALKTGSELHEQGL